VLTKGDHTKAMGIIDGHESELTQATRNLAQSNRSHGRVGRH
jgi:hypothetical protein